MEEPKIETDIMDKYVTIKSLIEWLEYKADNTTSWSERCSILEVIRKLNG